MNVKTMEDVSRITVSDAMTHLVELLRVRNCGHYGYDLHTDTVVWKLVHPLDHSLHHNAQKSLSRVYYDAAWELCVRGLVRPGVHHFQAQATSDGGGYSLTAFGRQWLAEPPTDPIIMSDPNRLANLIEQVRERFGSGFHQRSMEAIRCYQSHAYLATCVMCGAAAESILLKLAIVKSGDVARILRDYESSNGRGKLENYIVGQADNRTKRMFEGFLGLLKDWRDTSAHGQATTISADEAATALDLLVRFALYADREWDHLISRVSAHG